MLLLFGVLGWRYCRSDLGRHNLGLNLRIWFFPHIHLRVVVSKSRVFGSLSRSNFLSCMTDTKDLQELIYQEMRSKIKEEDADAPLRHGPYFYYTKNLEGQQYTVHCRRLAPGGEGPGHVDEVMETGSEAPEEEVLLDENKEAKGVEFYFVGEVKVYVWSTVIISGSAVSCPYTFLFIMELFYKYRSAYVVCWFEFHACPRLVYLKGIGLVSGWHLPGFTKISRFVV